MKILLLRTAHVKKAIFQTIKFIAIKTEYTKNFKRIMATIKTKHHELNFREKKGYFNLLFQFLFLKKFIYLTNATKNTIHP